MPGEPYGSAGWRMGHDNRAAGTGSQAVRREDPDQNGKLLRAAGDVPEGDGDGLDPAPGVFAE